MKKVDLMLTMSRGKYGCKNISRPKKPSGYNHNYRGINNDKIDLMRNEFKYIIKNIFRFE
jgi:hypothetical protein